jgi:cardiolipin synthase (CMP-forming)
MAAPIRGTAGSGRASSAILTLPNALSSIRIVTIPVFVVLIVGRRHDMAGLLVFAAVVSTDWIDGYIARRTGTVTELGKILDPTADRLVIAAGLIALIVRGAFPLWAAALIFVRDGAVLIAGAVLLAGRRIRIDVRPIGKVATFSLMTAIPAISWAHLNLPLATAASVIGWLAFVTGIVEYYAAAFLYAKDIRRALAIPADPRSGP